MTETREFHGDKKMPMSSFTAKLERKLIQATVHKFPTWIEGYHLTLMTILWSAGLIGFGYLARQNLHWLWLSSAMIALQWFTDSYDGSLGRSRDTGIPKWGYYMDHFLDYVFFGSLMVGYGFLLQPKDHILLFVFALIAIGFVINSYLSFGATQEFKITFMGFGPTEIRILFILGNTILIIFGVSVLEHILPYGILFGVCGLIFVVFRTQRYIWKIDMQDKQTRK